MVASLVAATSFAQGNFDKYGQGKLSWALHEMASALERGEDAVALNRRYLDPSTSNVVTVVELYPGSDVGAIETSIRDLGATIDAVDLEAGWLEVSAPITSLRRLERLPRIARIRLPHAPTRTTVVSEGIAVMNAGDFIRRTGADGAGVTVGVLDAAWEDLGSILGTEIPADTEISSSVADGLAWRVGRHGNGCAEVVHDVAPGAHLVLDTFRSMVGWSNALTRLTDRNIDVLSHSVAWTNLYPVDGTGYFARWAEFVSARGVLVVTAAGNDAHNMYQGGWSDADGDSLMEFAAGVELLPIWALPGGAIVRVRWDDDAGASAVFHDYDLFIVTRDFADAPSFDPDNPAIVASSLDVQKPGDLPVETVVVDVKKGRHLYAVIKLDERTPAKPDQRLFVYASDGVLEYDTAPGSITSPADARSVVAVGAVYASNLERPWYSAVGPTEDGRIKPDLAAPSHVASSSYPDGFGGTSAATPHAAGAAALLLSLYPELSVQQLKRLLETATSSGGDPALKDYNYGFGVIDLSKAQ